MQTLFFYAFSAILLVSALGVITARNPVHAALLLVLSFFSGAAVWMLLEAEFLAILLVLVYVGAVMVLFLFVVMMLDINLDQIRRGFWSNLPLATLVGCLVAFEMGVIVLKGFWMQRLPVSTPITSNSQALGELLYTEYGFAVEIASIILLVAMVAAIGLTHRTRKDSKITNPSQQVRVKAKDRIRMVRMDADLSGHQTKPPIDSKT